MKMKHIRLLKKHWTKGRVRHYATIVAAGGVIFAGIFVLWVATLKIPDLNSFETRKKLESTKIYDRTGEILLYDVHQDIRRTVVPFEEISDNLKKATVAIEDENFYNHNGIEPTSILRAVLVNIGTLGFSQGGSTITQQVVKNSLLTSEKSISRKFKEWILALKLDKFLSKDEILALYLNEIPYGGNIYGIEEASQAFFGKKASELSLAESAYLAALPQAPTRYSPHGNHTDQLEKRKNLVLRQMRDNKMITVAQYESALKEKVEWKEQERTGIKAPHFVFFVLQYLEERYGEKAIQEDGFRVITSLDYTLQEKAEKIAEKYAKENKTKFNAENAAFVAIDPKTGHILTMVGSRDYFDKEIQGNFNVALAHRQPGSTFKPFAYAEAFKKGYTPDTVLFDVKTEFSTSCSPQNVTVDNPDCYHPNNYDNIFRGPITMREALAQSINIPAVKTLYLAGLKDSLALAKSMGIESLGSAAQYGLTLVLGGGEVSLLDMVSSYSVFANEGQKNPYQPIIQISDRLGNIIEKPEGKPQEVLSPQVARQISNVLSDNVARAPAFGENSALNFPGREVAVKTGTTNDYKDAWIIGYTPSVVLGAWAGNNNNTSMSKKVAGFIVAPMWNALMTEALKSVPEETFTRPEPTQSDIKPVLRGVWQGNETYRVDRSTGKLATEFTPPELIEERSAGEIHSILHWVDRNDPLGPSPTNPANDPEYRLWEYAVQQWIQNRGIVATSPQSVPQESDDVHRPEFAPQISITGIDTLRLYKQQDTLSFTVVSQQSRFPLSRVDVFINGEPVSTLKNPPFNFVVQLSLLTQTREENELKIVGYDTVLNQAEIRTSFRMTP